MEMFICKRRVMAMARVNAKDRGRDKAGKVAKGDRRAREEKVVNDKMACKDKARAKDKDKDRVHVVRVVRADKVVIMVKAVEADRAKERIKDRVKEKARDRAKAKAKVHKMAAVMGRTVVWEAAEAMGAMAAMVEEDKVVAADKDKVDVQAVKVAQDLGTIIKAHLHHHHHHRRTKMTSIRKHRRMANTIKRHLQMLSPCTALPDHSTMKAPTKTPTDLSAW